MLDHPVIKASAPKPPTYTTSYTPPENIGKFRSPGPTAVDPSGNIWVFDTANERVLEFNSNREYVRQFGKEGSGPGQFSWFNRGFPGIGGIATNAAGDVYVSDFGDSRVEEFNGEGQFIRQFGNSGTSEEQVHFPSAVTVDSEGNVWVLDSLVTAGARVHEFSPTGQYKSRFGSSGSGEGQLLWAFGMTFSAGNLYVADFSHQRVLEFSTAGKLERQFDTQGSGNGESYIPWGIATDPSTGHLYVAEAGDGRVQEFSPEGSFITAFGSVGSGPGQFSSPRGLAVNSSGDLFVADTGNNRIEEWVPSP